MCGKMYDGLEEGVSSNHKETENGTQEAKSHALAE
jgi:hypothetical protein